VNRADVTELHYITTITNVPSILDKGLLSHLAVAKLAHETVDDPQVQDIRARKTTPAGRALHSYVNMFFHARNSMMYGRQNRHTEMCVIRIRTDVLDFPGVLVTDRNAAGPAVFRHPAVGIATLDKELVFARWWMHEDPLEHKRRKQIRSAEVLVPDRVAPDFITGAYVSCVASEVRLRELAPALQTTVYADLFFQ
jgi:hypothetical protein